MSLSLSSNSVKCFIHLIDRNTYIIEYIYVFLMKKERTDNSEKSDMEEITNLIRTYLLINEIWES